MGRGRGRGGCGAGLLVAKTLLVAINVGGAALGIALIALGARKVGCCAVGGGVVQVTTLSSGGRDRLHRLLNPLLFPLGRALRRLTIRP